MKISLFKFKNVQISNLEKQESTVNKNNVNYYVMIARTFYLTLPCKLRY